SSDLGKGGTVPGRKALLGLPASLSLWSRHDVATFRFPHPLPGHGPAAGRQPARTGPGAGGSAGGGAADPGPGHGPSRLDRPAGGRGLVVAGRPAGLLRAQARGLAGARPVDGAGGRRRGGGPWLVGGGTPGGPTPGSTAGAGRCATCGGGGGPAATR